MKARTAHLVNLLFRFVWGLKVVTCVALAQVPDESVLPSDRLLTLPLSEINESVLPGQQKSLVAVQAAQTPVPDERILPGGVNAPVVSPGNERPWLRLTFPGHTGRILTMDMDEQGTWMVSAGEDKDLHVWQRGVEEASQWFHRRTIRWPIERAQLGRIYTVAQKGTRVALAGNGALSGNGEIWIVELTTGALQRALIDDNIGHRQPLTSLVWAPGNAERLASADMDGRVLLWEPDTNTGIWSARVILPADAEFYGAETGQALMDYRSYFPIRFLNEHELLVPQYVGMSEGDDANLRWQLRRCDVRNDQFKLMSQVDHLGLIVSFCVSKNGKRMVTCDDAGKLFAWMLDGEEIKAIEVTGPAAFPVSLDCGDEGHKCLVGTGPDEEAGQSHAQLWDLTALPEQPKVLGRLSLPAPALACAIDEKHQEIVVASENRLLVHAWDNTGAIENRPRQVLASQVKPVIQVAFSTKPDSYRVAFGTTVSAEGAPLLDQVFDFSGMQLGRQAVMNADEWRDPSKLKGEWSLRAESDEEGDGHWFYRGDVKGAKLPLQKIMHGDPTSTAWIDDPSGKTQSLAAVVGSGGRDNIYVFEPAMEGSAKVIRQFRSHTGAVLSVSSSADGRYLVSGSEDTTLCIWKLEDVFTSSDMINRWGLEVEVQDDKLVASQVREDGPLFFRGVRVGDELVDLRWDDQLDGDHTAADPARMIDALKTIPFDTLVIFHWARRGRPMNFASYPAWQPMATLYVDSDREWACWTPAGYYTASLNGHQRFGWQINSGVNALPQFFRADQFRQKLEKPQVLQRLLKAGSLTQAMTQLGNGVGPPPGENAILNQFQTKPRIELLEPTDGQKISKQELLVHAKITVPLGAVLAPPKVFAAGVPAISRTVLSEVENEQGHVFEYQWKIRVPQDRVLPLEVLAATDAESLDRVTIRLQNDSPLPDSPPQLYVLAVGTNRYRDPQIPGLDFASRGAQELSNVFRMRTSKLYSTDSAELLNEAAVRPLWREYAAAAIKHLAPQVTPNDLVVMYFSGHGLRDRQTNQWYYVTSEAKYSDLMDDRYDDCLSFSDLAALAELPCRKLAILDTCHSGAIQPALQPDDLRAALRWLQDDVVLTLTASEGEEEAVEQREQRLGRFTAHLIEGLQGGADRDGGNQDGNVSLRETIAYVKRKVAEDSKEMGFVQHPTAGPADLLETLDLPLTQAVSP